MKASAYMSIGDWSKSVDVEIDSASESDVRFAKSILSSISEIKERPYNCLPKHCGGRT